MAYYNYKRVMHRPDVMEFEKRYKETDPEYEGLVDYDGDAWCAVAAFIDELQAKLSALATPKPDKLALAMEVVEAAKALGLETVCIIEPPCGDCRACYFRAALARFEASDAK